MAEDHGGVEESLPENPFAGQGSVLLDIGGDIGAIVVTMPSSMLDEEVEIRPAGRHLHAVGSESPDDGHDHGHGHGHGHDHGHLVHVAVVNRPVAGRLVASLVFGEVEQGSYELCPKGTNDVHLTVHVTGGEVTEATWPV